MDAPAPPPPDAPPAPICVAPKLSAAELQSGKAVIAAHPGGYGYASSLCGPHFWWSYFWFEALVFRNEEHARAVLGQAGLDPNFFRYRLYPKHCKVRLSPCTHLAPT